MSMFAILLLVLSLKSVISSSKNENLENEPVSDSGSFFCKSLVEGTTRPRIILTGFSNTKHYLILEKRQNISLEISKWLVYESDLSSLISNPYALSLSHNPKDLVIKWPNLANNKIFRFTRSRFAFAVTLMDSNSSYILFLNDISKKPQPQHLGATFDLTTSEPRDKLCFGFNGSEATILLSTDIKNVFYGIEKKPLRLTTWKFSSELIEGGEITRQDKAGRYMCSGEDESQIYLSNEVCPRPLEWKPINGYVFRQRFYLFTHISVYIFEEFNDEIKAAKKVKRSSYESYFDCQAKETKPKMTFNYIIMLTGVLLFLLLLTGILLLFQPTSSKQTKRLQNRNRNSSRFYSGIRGISKSKIPKAVSNVSKVAPLIKTLRQSVLKSDFNEREELPTRSISKVDRQQKKHSKLY